MKRDYIQISKGRNNEVTFTCRNPQYVPLIRPFWKFPLSSLKDWDYNFLKIESIDWDNYDDKTGVTL